jgi:hypothetical protein
LPAVTSTHSTASELDQSSLGSIAKLGLAIVLSIVAIMLIGVTANRVYKNYSPPSKTFDWSLRGHSDFHNGVYYPAVAFRNRDNPYAASVRDKYPVVSPARPCPPITFIGHLPFTFLDLRSANVAFFAFNTGMLLLLALVAVNIARGKFEPVTWLAACCVLLISRPGHITLFTGYYTLELVLGTVMALHYGKSRPWLSAVGMLVASGKPTFVLPLIILMLARKNYAATLRGIGLCIVFGMGGLAWLATDGGFSSVLSGVFEAQSEFHSEVEEYPVNSWTRVDLLGMAAKVANWIPADRDYLTAMLVFLIVPAVLINQITDRESNHGAAGLTSCIALLTMLVGIYHHSYDCLLIVVPWVGFAFCRSQMLPEASNRIKILLALLLTGPLLNYLSTHTARDKLGFEQSDTIWQMITMINGVCLMLALVILLGHAYHLAVANTIRKDFGR